MRARLIHAIPQTERNIVAKAHRGRTPGYLLLCNRTRAFPRTDNRQAEREVYDTEFAV